MTLHLTRPALAAAAALLLLAACGGGGNPAPVGPDQLLERGQQEAARGKHRRAAETLQQFVTVAPTDPRVPEALLAMGRAHMAAEEYVSAAAAFLRLATSFPQDPRGKDARLGMCESYVRLSPKPALDQEYTRAAIVHCESVAAIYPGTPEAQQATGWVSEMKGKLARKEYESGMFYFRRKAYDASVIYFAEAANGYPGTPWAAAALARMVEAYDAIGYDEERDAAKARLLREYPESAGAPQPAA
jgi:outer membrane protein assembly factor BamD